MLKKKESVLVLTTAVALSFWTALIACLYIWGTINERKQNSKLLKQQARAFFQEVLTTRAWNAAHGGVYVPITSMTQPNPYLEDPERDIVTQKGTRLTKINPAYMTRQIAEIAEKNNLIRFHITSAQPIRPENIADQWELNALELFVSGKSEFSEFLENEEEKTVFRYMAPLWVKSNCLKCHSSQGYKEGDLRGGISVSITADSIVSIQKKAGLQLKMAYLVIWGFGIVGIFFGYRQLKRETLHRMMIIDDLEVSIRKEKKLIATKQQSEARLIESERYYRGIYNSSSDVILIYDAGTGKIMDANQTMEDMFGYTHQEALQLEIGDIDSGTPPFTKEEIYKKTRKVIDQGPQLFECSARHKDGTSFWIEVALKNTTIGGRGMAVIRDITQRKKMDSELLLVKHSVEHSAYPFEWIQKDARFFYANKASCCSLGYSHEELYTMHVSDIDPDFPVDRWPGFWKELKSKKVLTFETRHRKKNGDIFPVEITANYLEFEEQEHVFAYVKDISDRVQYENKQRALEKQLQQAHKMEAIGTLAGGIAHDFNNILSGIFGYSQLAQTHIKNPEKASRNIDQVLNGAKRAAELAQQILTFSRQTEYKKKPFKIYHQVNEALKLLRSTIPSTIEIKKGLHSKSMVSADPVKIHQVIMNLCTNAYHAMSKTGGRLTVSLTDIEIFKQKLLRNKTIPPGNYIELRVSDTGYGMDEDIIEKAFDPYYTTKKTGEGTGLGLAIVQAIVDEHDGYLEVKSSPGKGTSFYIYFPIVTKDVEEKEKKFLESVSLEGSEKILFVDDESAIREIAKENLEKYGYEVILQKNGIEALNEFEKDSNQFDLIITDMNMPGMAGDKLLDELKKINSNIPTILCTGFSDTMTEERAASLGISGFLMKPIQMNQLCRKIRQVMDKKVQPVDGSRVAFLFARHGGQTQPGESRRHPDQGEDNPNCKGVAGNGRV